MHRTIDAVFSFLAALLCFAAPIGTAAAQPLVDPAWLRQHLNDHNLVVLEVYVGDQRAAFASGHIPGALFTDFSRDGWRARVGAAPGMLPAIEDVSKLLGSFGIDNKSRVILVPGGREWADFNASARIYWTFKALGHDSVSILQGGVKAWFSDKSNPVVTGATKALPKKYAARLRRDYLATRDDVRRALRTQDAQLIDARPPAQFEGKAKSPAVRVAGTLPGAVNVPAAEIVTPDGSRLADAATIDQVLAKAGVKTSGKQIVFCNTGHLASGTWFLLREVKGNKEVSLYAGSMSDWTSDIKQPVAHQRGSH